MRECQDAFEFLKQRLTNAPILTHPDFSRDFILDTDASNEAIGFFTNVILPITAISTLFAWDTAQCVVIRMLVSRPVDNFHIIFTQDL
jgi:hypothetical protein